jgi:hypothetical protein
VGVVYRLSVTHIISLFKESIGEGRKMHLDQAISGNLDQTHVDSRISPGVKPSMTYRWRK